MAGMSVGKIVTRARLMNKLIFEAVVKHRLFALANLALPAAEDAR
jgi:hypothetical protein